jgi:hypothetical protein
MTKKQNEHLAENLAATVSLMTKKYKAGQKEHSGNLWEKPGMLRNAENEVADLNNYLPTLRKQLNDVRLLLESGNNLAALSLLRDVLSEQCG